jgi:ComF family protein
MLFSPLQFLGDLLYPDLCLACDTNKKMPADIWCASCAYKVSIADYYQYPNNKVMERFYGKIELHRAMTLFNFAKGGYLQNLVHKLKYDNRPEIGIALGKLCGGLLATQADYDIDVVVPVPMHPEKEFKRGYNQATLFGKGIAEMLNCRLSTRDFIKTKATVTQTAKSRAERLENVKDVFYIANEAALSGKHILLVDDVITTGATLEACVDMLNKIPNIRISIACIALAGG